jgi:hypothetical protein
VTTCADERLEISPRRLLVDSAIPPQPARPPGIENSRARSRPFTGVIERIAAAFLDLDGVVMSRRATCGGSSVMNQDV